MLNLLENSTLLDHDNFTEMLLALFHLAEELESRNDLSNLTLNDALHIKKDVIRAYSRLLSEWIIYAKYLMEDYPFLYALLVRKNPFDPTAKAELD